MNVRWKLFIVMTGMCLLFSLLYIALSRGYLDSLFEDYSRDKLSGYYQSYYVNNGYSWDGIDQVDIPDGIEHIEDEHGGVALVSPGGDVLSFRGQRDISEVLTGETDKIRINGNVVATVYVDHWDSTETLRLREFILREMVHKSILGAAIVGGLSLLVGLLLSWRLTMPLKKLIPAIEKMGKRNFQFDVPVTSKDEYGKVALALNEMSKQLRHAEEVRKHLVGDVAHELRTPLAILRAKLELFQHNGQAVAPELLLPMQDELIRLSKLVDDLHELTLAEAGKLPLHKKHIKLDEFMDGIVRKMQSVAEGRKIELSLHVDAVYTVVDIDPNKITQIFYNLIGNAIRFTGSGGRITISVENQQQEGGKSWVTVSVADTGVGIPEEHLPYLFGRFYRVEESRSRESGGMGLGLAIAKELAEAHEGTITAVSQIGIGSTFTVYLPASNEAANKAENKKEK